MTQTTKTSETRSELLSIERYAEVLAHVHHFGVEHCEEVCARMRVDGAVWEASDAHWPDVLEADSAAEAPVVAIGFGRAYAPVEKRLAAEKPSIETLGPLPEPLLPGPGSPSTAEPAAAEEPTPTVAPPALGPSPSGGGRSVSPPGIVTPRQGPVRRERSPWGADPSPAPAAPPPRRAATDETALVNAVPEGNPLPFVADAPERTRARLPRGVRERTPSAGSTSEIPAILADPNATLPFQAIAHVPPERDLFARLTLAQYASLCAELASDPARHDPTVRRYGIDDATWPALRDAWDRRFAREPHERRSFDEMFARYRAWLTHNR
jgi:hypothetical protein